MFILPKVMAFMLTKELIYTLFNRIMVVVTHLPWIQTLPPMLISYKNAYYSIN